MHLHVNILLFPFSISNKWLFSLLDLKTSVAVEQGFVLIFSNYELDSFC